MNVSIKDITKILNGQLILGSPLSVVTNASVDSRKIDPGCLFFALKGERVDGHEFVTAAFRQGAVGSVVSHLDWLRNENSITSAVIRVNDSLEALQSLGRYLRNQFKGPVVGITGSNGKTTTKQMVASVLGQQGEGLSTLGNYNSQIGLPLVLSKLEAGHKWMVLEMGASSPGNIATLAEIAHPTIGVLTSIGPAHLETFGSIQRIAETKWELMDSLPNDGCAIVPWGEPAIAPFIRSFKKKIVFFGDDPACPVRSSAVQVGERIRFMLHIGSQNAPVTLNLPGQHNVSNALAAAAVGWVLGYSIESIIKGLETFDPPKMRMQILPHASGAVLINDAYNANPSSMLVSVRSLAESYPERKKIVVIGSMLELGFDSDKYHFHLGVELARFNLEHIFLVGKETKAVKEGVVSAGGSTKKISSYDTAENVTGELKKYLSKDVAVLFKGSRGIQLEKALETL